MDTNETTELMHSTSDVARTLGIGNAMVRKYAIAYEEVSGNKIRLKSKRDGREFSDSQVDIIRRAKELVDVEGARVDTALRMVLEKPDLAAGLSARHDGGNEALEVLQAILAKNDETNRLLLEELRGLRSDIKESRVLPTETVEMAKYSVESATPSNDTRHGFLVKAAMWIEKRLRGS